MMGGIKCFLCGREMNNGSGGGWHYSNNTQTWYCNSCWISGSSPNLHACGVITGPAYVETGDQVRHERDNLKKENTQIKSERDNWRKWCMQNEEYAAYLRDKLDNIRQEADIRQQDIVRGDN